MRFEELDLLGLVRRVLEEMPQGLEPEGPMADREMADALDVLPCVLRREREEAHEDANTLDPAGRYQRLAPARGLGTDLRGALEEVRRSVLDGADLLGGDVSALRAEAARLDLRV